MSMVSGNLNDDSSQKIDWFYYRATFQVLRFSWFAKFKLCCATIELALNQETVPEGATGSLVPEGPVVSLSFTMSKGIK